MAEPFLHLGDIGLMRKGIGGGRRPHRMHAEAVDFDVQAGFLAVLPHDVPINRIRVKRSNQRPCIVPHLNSPQWGTTLKLDLYAG